MIPIAKPLLDELEGDAARKAVLSGWVTQGPEVRLFELEFASRVGANHACAVSNCTTALHLALLAVGVGAGDEVIVPSHSFVATANAIRYCNAIPVFVDIDPRTFNIDPDRVEEAITSRTRAILAVHQMGMPCDLPALAAIAQRRGVSLIEDAACAAGSQILIAGAWENIGTPVGEIACFSFHPRKVITTGEGGMLTTQHSDLDHAFRRLRQHGMNVSDVVRHGSSKVIFEDYECVGYNYRMSEMQAAIGRKQIERLSGLVTRRRHLADGYHELLGNLEGLILPFEPEWARSNWQSYCVRLPDWADQKTIMQEMLDNGIATRRGIMCAHREPCYSDEPRRHDLCRSEAAQDHCILLPLYAQMTSDDQLRVAVALRHALYH